MIDGVCGGLAEYFDIDPTIVRILMVMIGLLGGTGFLLYIVAMVIMPVNPDHLVIPQPTSPTVPPSSERKRLWGVILILIGAFILLMNLGWLTDFSWWSFSSEFVFPITLILLGLFFIYIQTRKKFSPPPISAPLSPEEPGQPQAAVAKELRRSITEKKVCGVCGGIAKYFSLDPTIVRIGFVVLVLASFGWGLLLYIALCVLMPEEKPVITSL